MICINYFKESFLILIFKKFKVVIGICVVVIESCKYGCKLVFSIFELINVIVKMLFLTEIWLFGGILWFLEIGYVKYFYTVE